MLTIRNAYASFEDRLTDEMCTHFANKKVSEFWKLWKAKFRKNINKHITINGYTDDAGISNEFAVHFNTVFCYSSHDSTALLVSVISFWLVTIILATSVLTM